MSELLTAEQLLTPLPLEEKTVEIDGLGKIKLKQLSFSQEGKLSMWLFPKGKRSKQRQSSYGLKMVTECLVNHNGEKLFDFPDTEAGNKAFFEFADKIGAGASGYWSEVINEVRLLNKDGEELEDETNELLGKSDS